MIGNFAILADDLIGADRSYLPYYISLAIVVLGLCVYGLHDLVRFSISRVMAIGTVCFRDAIRRRVLWITPLAMLGVIVVSQLTNPIDQPDAIRLTIKFCLFTSAIVVTIVALITSATNLPREIENRVIFTIVTKPVTRLEIILGKIIGFARVSATVLFLMGLFSLSYLHLRAWSLGGSITQALNTPGLDDSSRQWLTHFNEEGLLFSHGIGQAESLQMYARVPKLGQPKWMFGQTQETIYEFAPAGGAKWFIPNTDTKQLPGANGGVLSLRMAWEPLKNTSEDASASSTTQPAVVQTPTIQVQFLDMAFNSLVSADKISTTPITLGDPQGKEVNIFLQPEVTNTLARAGRFRLQITGVGENHLFGIAENATLITYDDTTFTKSRSITSIGHVRGADGRFGQQLRAATDSALEPVAVFNFRHQDVPVTSGSTVPFEMNVGIERSGSDSDVDQITYMQVRVAYTKSADSKNPQVVTSDPIDIRPESKRTLFFDVPSEYVNGKDFNVLVYNITPGNVIGLQTNSLLMITSREYFGFNLLRGLVVIWMFAVLTSIVALTASTFLSWPIAVVLTLVVLLAQWAIANLDLGTGLGAQIAQEFFSDNAFAADTVNKIIESLIAMLRGLANVLPKSSLFDVTEMVELGQRISLTSLLGPARVIIVFGFPLLVIAYWRLRNKEVAP